MESSACAVFTERLDRAALLDIDGEKDTFDSVLATPVPRRARLLRCGQSPSPPSIAIVRICCTFHFFFN